MKSNDRVVAEQRGPGSRWVALAFVWMIGFSIWFHHFELPNNHVPRWLLWTAIPFDMMDLVDPPVQPGSAPWSWLFLAQRVPFIGIAMAIWTAAWGFGSLILRTLGVGFQGCTRHFFALCLGLSSVSLVMLSLGVCGCMSRWPLMALLAAPCVIEAIIRRRHPGSAHSDNSVVAGDRQRRWSRLGWIMVIGMAPFVIGQLLGAMTPQTDFDVVEYHLGGPKEWFQRGQIVRLPHNVYTSFPFLSEMLILAGMVLYGDWQWGALAGQAATAGFSPLTALGLFAAGRRWFSEETGWLAALIYSTSPWTYRISIIAYAEGGLSCYLFAALFALLLFRDQIVGVEPVLGQQPTRLSILAGLLAGSAMACKYTGLVSVVIPIGTLIVVIAARHARSARFDRAVPTGFAFALGVCAAVGPWLLKNAVETGNPIYPLAVRVFGGVDRDEELDAKWIRAHLAMSYNTLGDRLSDLPVKLADVTANNDWHSPLMFALMPLSLFWCLRRRQRASLNDEPRLLALKEWPGRSVFAEAPMSLSKSEGWPGRSRSAEAPVSISKIGQPVLFSDQASQRSVVKIVCLYVAWQFFTWWILTHHIDRFYVPMFSAVALLSGVGATWWASGPLGLIGNRGVLLWKRGVAAVIIASLLYNAELMIQDSISGFNAGRLDLKAAREIATAPRVKWLNDEFESGRLPLRTKVLCVGEAAMFHARYPYLYNTVFDRSLFETICADPKSLNHKLRSAADIRAEFQRLGITLIDVNWAEILRYREPGSYGYTDFAHPERFEQLQQRGLLGPALSLPNLLTFAPLDSDLQKRLTEWAPGLITSFEGKPAYIKAQIFPVLTP